MQSFWRFTLRRINHHLSSKFPTLHEIHTDSLPPKNKIVYDYLINTFNFPKPKALNYSNTFAKVKTLQKPQSVVKYLKSLGFTDTQIISSAKIRPNILFSDIKTTLRPKIEFFQNLGISGTNLGDFISRSSHVLGLSLSKNLKPTVRTIVKILSKHNVEDANEKLLRVIQSSKYVFGTGHKQLLANVLYFKSCGVSDSQLVRLLLDSPMLLCSSEPYLKMQISRVLDLGFKTDSRMFVIGLVAISRVSNETFLKKLNLFGSLGFSEIEFKEMVKGFPNIIKLSQEKLRFGVGFYLETVGLEKSVLIRNPVCLTLDMRNRVVPRYKVVNLLKSKGILEKEYRFPSLVKMTEKKFVEKYITRFNDHAEDLWDAYKGHLVDSSGLKQPYSK